MWHQRKTIAHSTILNISISCVVVISIFGFKKCWQKVFDFMDLNMRPPFKQLLLSETINANKKKA